MIWTAACANGRSVVQDDLKSIFAKSGTGSRGDLIAKRFFDHYATSLTSGDDQPAPM